MSVRHARTPPLPAVVEPVTSPAQQASATVTVPQPTAAKSTWGRVPPTAEPVVVPAPSRMLSQHAPQAPARSRAATQALRIVTGTLPTAARLTSAATRSTVGAAARGLPRLATVATTTATAGSTRDAPASMVRPARVTRVPWRRLASGVAAQGRRRAREVPGRPALARSRRGARCAMGSTMTVTERETTFRT